LQQAGRGLQQAGGGLCMLERNDDLVCLIYTGVGFIDVNPADSDQPTYYEQRNDRKQ
jgi:hypothetical protein